jgi:hypothetical protein
MAPENSSKTAVYPVQLTTRKVTDLSEGLVAPPSDSLAAWIPLYLQLAVSRDSPNCHDPRWLGRS